MNAFQICDNESYELNNSIFEYDSLDRQLVGTNVFENFNSANSFLTAEKNFTKNPIRNQTTIFHYEYWLDLFFISFFIRKISFMILLRNNSKSVTKFFYTFLQNINKSLFLKKSPFSCYSFQQIKVTRRQNGISPPFSFFHLLHIWASRMYSTRKLLNWSYHFKRIMEMSRRKGYDMSKHLDYLLIDV